MKKILILFLFAAILVSYVSCTKDKDNSHEPPVVVETFLDVSYGSNA